MEKWTRFLYQPVSPLGEDGGRITGSREHIALSRQAAAEGMVLLKNEGKQLPFARGRRVALFGRAGADYVKGGGGSGDVTTAYVKTLIDGMEEKEAEGKISLFSGLNDFYRSNVKEQYEKGIIPGQTTEPDIPAALMEEARAFCDTALISICRFSGEDWDRPDSDYDLTEQEKRMVDIVTGRFEHVTVVLNVGGMVDTSWFKDNGRIQSVLLAWQGGMEGGPAAADLLCGDRNPSGKLTDTFAKSFAAYPSSAAFHESDNYAAYTEDIYVGYRYFETVPGASEKVNYCFGYGLSYTDFSIRLVHASREDGGIQAEAEVTNTGGMAGREVVQLYASAPQGLLGKPARELKDFAKTRLLLPGESQRVFLHVREEALSSYDDTGKVCKSAWILEKGAYRFYLGNSVRNAQNTGFMLDIPETKVILQLSEKCAPRLLKERMRADGTMEAMPSFTGDKSSACEYDPELVKAFTPAQPEIPGKLMAWEKGAPEERPQFSDVAKGKLSLNEFMESLSDRELAHLLGGQPNTGVANTWGIGNLPQAGIPNVMTADGPAGLRIQPECMVCTTAFPCATLLACTFDEALVEEIGRAGGLEVKENNIGVWLTPAMNIHRSPLCGRNFEYYSEDPLVAGKIGAALVRGIQSNHIAASVKHFACNNKETNRKNSDSRLSERALREIYLKGFETVVNKADPWTIMTSYNIINGTRASENRDLLTGILREEWGFGGMVTTDWWNFSDHPAEALAGNDVKMPVGKPERLLAALEEGILNREDLLACAGRILEMILKLD